MSSIEKLTDEDRDELFEANYRVCSKALRIIDQLTATLEAAERKADDLQIEAGEARKHYRAAEQNVVWVREQRIAAESRAEALQARVAELLEHVVTAADKAVLDAMAKASEKDLSRGHRGDWTVAVLSAELARREAAK